MEELFIPHINVVRHVISGNCTRKLRALPAQASCQDGAGVILGTVSSWGLLQGLPNAKTALNLPRGWEVLQNGKNYTMKLHSPS